MRGGLIGGVSPGSMDGRHRPPGVLDDSSKRKPQRIGILKEVDKFSILVSERSLNCSFGSLKVVLLSIICGALLTIIYAPSVYNEHLLHSGSRFTEAGWMWAETGLDPRYVSHMDVPWVDLFNAIGNLEGRTGELKVGLLNFNDTEVGQWQQNFPQSESSIITLEPVMSSVAWENLYPEWIDEEEENEIPVCPSLPHPEVPKGLRFNLIAVKLPCNRSGSWRRDVARLHLQLSAAKLAVASLSNGDARVHVMFVTECFPIQNLFLCKHLAKREGDVWLYKPNLRLLRENLRLPVGSCELAVPLNTKARLYSVDRKREAYATILHSADVYVCGAIVAAQSIRRAGSTRDLVVLVDESIGDEHRSGLEAAGWQVRTIQRIRNPKAKPNAYNEWNYSKFRLWQLTDYDKIVFIDADLLVLRNIDFLFAMPEIAATGNNASLFNSGVMVIEPSNCTFQLLMDHVNEIQSYNGGDQGFLNEIFVWWHRIPKHMNFLKHFWEGDEERVRAKNMLFGSDPPVLYVLHYLGLKPWQCFRDYDCNWNAGVIRRRFASDAAHARWWRVHDEMPGKLKEFCLLKTQQKAGLEWDRRRAEKAKYADGHWRKEIADPRLGICMEEFCLWESMLVHWGEANWTGKSPA